jgi:hypothetical protein
MMYDYIYVCVCVCVCTINYLDGVTIMPHIRQAKKHGSALLI